MEILYEGIRGSAPTPWVAWLCGIAGVILLGIIIYALIENEKSAALWSFVMVILCAFLCIENAIDSRYPIVKATINDTIPWKEVNEKYTLIDQEGDIYIFRVKENTNE